MANLNKFLCIGRMVKDCETTHTQAGLCVCKFTIASNEKYKDIEKTEYTNFTAFGKTGELISRYCSKGSELYTESIKETTKYQKDGQDRWSTAFIVSNFQFIGKRADSMQGQQPQQNKGGFQQQQQGQGVINQQWQGQYPPPNDFQPTPDYSGGGFQQSQDTGDGLPF